MFHAFVGCSNFTTQTNMNQVPFRPSRNTRSFFYLGVTYENR
nr:MAG TPA: hypothetical protein [Caudoviricetes sp.]